MQKHNFFTDRYEVMLVVVHVLLMAMVIFFMNLTTTFQVSLLAASVLLLAWMMHSRDTEYPPCGASIDPDPIVRPRPGYEHPVI